MKSLNGGNMKRLYGAVATAALWGATSAWAVKIGDNLYIKTKGVKLLKDAKATAAAVGKELSVGDAVVWKGADAKDKAFHQVEAGGKPGFVLMTSLSPNKPSPETMETGKEPIDAKSFASSGAATKALKPHLDTNEGSVGISVNITHTAATLPGQTVTASAAITAVEGRKITFKVTAHDGLDKIGEGTHIRAIVPWDRFKAGVAAKAQKAKTSNA